MQDLRFVGQTDDAFLFESDNGKKFRVTVDDELIDALRVHNRTRPQRSGSRVSPREIQALLRSGVSSDEVADRLEIDAADVARYEGPILAEFSFMLEAAKQVAVRTEPKNEDETQSFGEVIEERLQRLSARNQEWKTWKHEEDGWMLQVEFESHDSPHTAIWAFDHRKSVLTPITPDAVNLSKQGDVGAKLIPTLRAVDRLEETASFDPAAFDVTDNDADADSEAPSESPEHPFVAPLSDDDFTRRQEIEQRAIATDPQPQQDLGHTADLLDALRRRRSHREAGEPEADERPPFSPPASINPSQSELNLPEADTEFSEPAQPEPETTPEAEPDRPAKKGRASIPSWDDILFGTRGDDD